MVVDLVGDAWRCEMVRFFARGPQSLVCFCAMQQEVAHEGGAQVAREGDKEMRNADG